MTSAMEAATETRSSDMCVLYDVVAGDDNDDDAMLFVDNSRVSWASCLCMYRQ